MTPAQKRAVHVHRKRQKQKGNVRVEVSIAEQHRALIKTIAAKLRAGASSADRFRSALVSMLEGNELIDFKRFLELAPLDDVDLREAKTRAGILSCELSA